MTESIPAEEKQKFTLQGNSTILWSMYYDAGNISAANKHSLHSVGDTTNGKGPKGVLPVEEVPERKPQTQMRTY